MIIGASLSEPHSSEDNAEVVCLSVCLSWTGTALDLMFLALTILTFDAAAHNWNVAMKQKKTCCF